MNTFLSYFCFHLTVRLLSVFDWGNYGKWWSILGTFTKIWYTFLFLPNSQSSICTLKALTFFFLLFSGSPCKAGWERFFWCLYSRVTCFSRVSYCSLSHSPSWCADIQMSHQCLFIYLFLLLLDWYSYVKFIPNACSEYICLPSICLAYWTKSD